MKINTVSTKHERLRLIFGYLLAVVGLVILLGLGAIYGYHNSMVWVLGLSTLLAGILIAKSAALGNFLNNILRF